jgi:ABC-2 type transport system ATP-binding protein
MIEVQGLSKSYGDHNAIKNLNFQVRKGEVVGFLGPNGAGKSTTMKIITGFMAPSAGVAKIGGIDVFEDPISVKRKIGYLPETPPVYGDMTVKDYLVYVAKLKGVVSSLLDENVEMAMNKTHLKAEQNRLIQHLSKGFRQRVGIAQALVSNPEILILDEPTVGLDPKQVAEIRDLIKELRGKHTIILSTHILSEVEATCERVIIINRGEIVTENKIENLTQLGDIQKVHLRIAKRISQQELSQGVGADKVTEGKMDGEWYIETVNNPELIETIAAKVIANKWGLLEIGATKANLEDVFIKLTYDKQKGVEV